MATRTLDKGETSIKFIVRGIQSLQMSKVEPSEGVKNTRAWLPVYLSINCTANNVIYVCVNVFSAQKVHQGQEILHEDC